MFKLSQLIKSFRYALRGLCSAWRTEQNIRLQSAAGALVLVAAWWLRVSPVRVAVLILLITLVLVLELLNTFFEKLIDFVSPRLHGYAATLKDLLAAAVLVAALGAAVVGVIIFWPYLVK